MEERDISIWIPSYEQMRGFLHAVDGFCYSELEDMFRARTVNIRQWVEARLSHEKRDLAFRTQQGSDEVVDLESVNEWDIEHFYLWHGENWIENDVVSLHVVENDIIRLTEDGRRFRENDEEIISKIDEFEGLLFILGAIVESESCSYKDLLNDFKRFYRKYVLDGYFEFDDSGEFSLKNRLRHKKERRLIQESSQVWVATELGRDYYRRCQRSAAPDSSLALLAEMKDVFTRRQLAKLLQKMNPNKFEELIKRLFQKLGYKNVVVTGQPGDGGIDLRADVNFSVTYARQVIQVKRQQGNVGIDVVDRLRGSLHRAGTDRQAIGMIVTTSGFTRRAREAAVEKGVSPITLIDGEKLLDLLVKHDV